MNTQPPAHRSLHWLLRPRLIIFGLCLLTFVLTLINVLRIDREITAYGPRGHWYPGAEMIHPLLLLLSAVALLVNRRWSLLLAAIASARVFYHSGYLPWTAVYYAHGVPMLGWEAMKKLWFLVYQPWPQYLFEVVLATAVFLYAFGLLTRAVFSKRAYISRRRITKPCS